MTELEPERVEPTSRRIRVRLGDRLVADSRRALLLIQYGPGGLPTYFVPRDDVLADALADEAPGPGGQSTWDVRGVTLPEPLPPFGLYVPAVRTGDLVFLSGAGPAREDGTIVTGRRHRP